MMRRRYVVFGTFAVFATGCVTTGQAPESVKKDLLVRVWTSACQRDAGCDEVVRNRHQGALIAMSADSLTLLAWNEPDPAVTLPLESVGRIELYRGKVPSVEGAAKRGFLGALMGAAAGAALGAATGAFEGDVGAGMAEGAVVFGTAGLLAGVYAEIFEGSDHWEDVRVKSLYTIYCLTNDKADCTAEEDMVGA